MQLAQRTEEIRHAEAPDLLPSSPTRSRVGHRLAARRAAELSLVGWSIALAGAAWLGVAVSAVLSAGARADFILPVALLGWLTSIVLGHGQSVAWRSVRGRNFWIHSATVSAGTVLIGVTWSAAAARGSAIEVVGLALSAAIAWSAAQLALHSRLEELRDRATPRVAIMGPREARRTDMSGAEIEAFHFDSSPRTHGVSVLPEDVGWRHLESAIAEGAVDRVIVSDPRLDRDRLMEIGGWCLGQGVEACLASEEFDVLRGRTAVRERDGKPVFRMSPAPRSRAYRRGKRVFDAVFSTAGVFGLAPLLGLLALLVRRSSPGPVLFRQSRVGEGESRFEFMKFRSMRTGASTDTHQDYIKKLAAGEGPAAVDKNGQKIYKLVNDPRITPIGQFIRKTSLDELPQLVNVLRGEMSLVGPRPCLPYEIEVYKDWHRRRMDATPGCTGLWQVTGRSTVDFDEMMVLDLHYVFNASLLDDLRLIVLTLPVMACGRGGM